MSGYPQPPAGFYGNPGQQQQFGGPPPQMNAQGYPIPPGQNMQGYPHPPNQAYGQPGGFSQPNQNAPGRFQPPPSGGYGSGGYHPGYSQPGASVGGFAAPPPQNNFAPQGQPGFAPQQQFQPQQPQQPQQYGVGPPHVPKYYLGTALHPSEIMMSPPHERAQSSQAVDGYNPTPDVEKIHKACKGIGTSEKKINEVFINMAANKLPVLEHAWKARHGTELANFLKKELSGNYEMLILQILNGPLAGDVELLEKACVGAGTNEELLTEVLIGRHPFELDQLKAAFTASTGKDLERVVLDELSLKTKAGMQIALLGSYQDLPNGGRTREFENIGGGVGAGATVGGFAGASNLPPINQNLIASDLTQITKSHWDVSLICSIVFARSLQHLNALQNEYLRTKKRAFTKTVKQETDGHLREMLLFALEGAKKDTTGAWRDAKRLHKAMEGVGTKDFLLVTRLVRAHWDPKRLQLVKQAYFHKYKTPLLNAVVRETSGDYRDACIALIG